MHDEIAKRLLYFERSTGRLLTERIEELLIRFQIAEQSLTVDVSCLLDVHARRVRYFAQLFDPQRCHLFRYIETKTKKKKNNKNQHQP